MFTGDRKPGRGNFCEVLSADLRLAEHLSQKRRHPMAMESQELQLFYIMELYVWNKV